MCAKLQNASGDYCVFMDADLQHPPEPLKEMYRVIKTEGYDCCGVVSTAYHLCGYSYPAYQAPVLSIMNSIKSRGNWKDCNLSNYQSVLVPGDVIIVTTGHVAIYAGGNQMIHAPLPGQYVCYATVYSCIGGGFGG